MTAPHDGLLNVSTAIAANVNAGRAGTLPAVERSRVIDRLEHIIVQDIGGRGLARDPSDNLVTRCQGNLARAARNLAEEGTAVAIVTGFYVAHAQQPTIETDGPCGAIALAWVLARLGLRVTLVTDPLGAAIIEAGVRAASLGKFPVTIEIFPFENDDPNSVERNSNYLRDSRHSQAWVESFFRSGPGGQLSHLVAVERAGPSHLEESHSSADEPSNADRPNEEGRARDFEWNQGDPYNQVHNFRGRVITRYTAKTHLLFDFVRINNLPVRTIGIGDGGNEIGMGSIPLSVLQANIPDGLGSRIACRVGTRWTIACGVSNWGAYALGTAVAWLRGRPELLSDWTDEREREVLAALVDAGAVDGVSGQPTMSVDGLTVEQHLAIWSQIREAARMQLGTMKS